MTCVTAARASHLIFRAEISKACSGRAGCSWHRIPFFLCLFRAGGEHLVPGEGQHSGDVGLMQTGCVCRKDRKDFVGFWKESDNTSVL